MDKDCYNNAKKSYASLGSKTKKLGFGLMRLPLIKENEYKNVDINKAEKMVDAFIENGFTYFDTAYIYHGGLGEKITKKILVDRYPREMYTLATKLPCMILKSADDNERFFSEQLANLGVGYFDYYLLHSIGGESYIDAERFNSFEFCRNKKKEGLIKHFGFSFHDSPELLEKILNDHPDVDFVQLQINYLDWESVSIKSKQCYDICAAHGKPVIVMEPVKGGTLANLPDNAEALMKNYSKCASPSSWAIRFAASLSNVMMVLSGMSDIPHMNDNIGFMRDFVPINDDERQILNKITEILNADGSIPCTGCNYCTGVCRQGIKIPYLFAAYNDDLKSKNDQFSIQNTMYRHYSATNKSAADCLKCHACEKVCPQHLPIAKLLNDVKNHFGK